MFELESDRQNATNARCAICHRDAHRPNSRGGNHGHGYATAKPESFFYLFSEDTGKTFRTIAIVSAATRAEIQARPLTRSQYVRKFKACK